MPRPSLGPQVFSLAIAFATVPAISFADTFDVTVRAMTFDPPSIQIHVGDTVHWVLAVGTHTVTSGTSCTPNGLFNAPLDPAHPEFSFTFTSPGTVDYFCQQHCGFGMDAVVEVLASSGIPIPGSREEILASSAPNPFHTHTELTLSLPEAGPLRVEIFDAAGRSITTLHDGWSDSGVRRMTWDGTRSDGTRGLTGIYLARISAGSLVTTLVLTRFE